LELEPLATFSKEFDLLRVGEVIGVDESDIDVLVGVVTRLVAAPVDEYDVLDVYDNGCGVAAL
jgi:hypothetical protein